MHKPIFHFHNDFGIQLPTFDAGVKEEGIFFRRFVGLVYPGRTDSIIGRGGSGVIHVVRDRIMDRVVALKLPNESILAEPQVRNEVLNEASQALELTHPNIVRIYDFHDQDGRWGISMQYIRGRNLDEWRDKLAPHQMASGSFYDVDQIKSWVTQLCEALAYAHEEAGIAHCDIKPRNLLLERSFDTRARQLRERLLLTDFGITQKLRDFTTRTQRHSSLKSSSGTGDEGGAAGTLAYMSPQQLAGGESTIADDIYATGVTIYELLTGRPPFYQGDAKVIQHQIESVVPPSMMARRQERGVKAAAPIPDLWEQVTAQCLHKDPAKRPATARELARLLGLNAGASSMASEQEILRLKKELDGQRETAESRGRKVTELSTRVQQLETARAGMVEEAALRQAREEMERQALALQEKEAQVGELDEQLQDLEEEKAALERRLADATLGTDEAVKRAAAERDEVASRLEQAQAEAARVREERDAARSAAKTTEKSLDDLRAKLNSAVKEAADAAAKAKAADAQVQKVRDEESAARKKAEAARAQAEQKLESARVQAEQKLAQAREQAEEARKKALTLEEAQTAPMRPILIMLLGVVVLGALLGTAIGWLNRDAGADEIAEIVQRTGDTVMVKKQDVQMYLRQIGFEDSMLGDHFASLAPEQPATGLSWTEAAGFCEWLTRITGRDGSSEWFDLPSMAEAAQGKAADQEWTREEQANDGSAGVNRLMKVYNHASPQQPGALSRSDRSGQVGFRCVLRRATTSRAR